MKKNGKKGEKEVGIRRGEREKGRPATKQAFFNGCLPKPAREREMFESDLPTSA